MKNQQFNSVWDAIENIKTARMKVRSAFMITLHDAIEKMGMTQAAAAKKLGITQPRLNDLLRGRINRFSLDALVDLTARVGLEIRIKFKTAA